MLKNFYQNGIHIELFNNQNKDLMNCWKFTGNINKEFDRNLQGYISVLSKNYTISKMEIPTSSKSELSLNSNFLVFQVFFLSNKSLLIEITVSDMLKNKKRLLFSSSVKEVSLTYYHSKFPLHDIPLNKWLNLSIDVMSFAADFIKHSYNFRTIDSISISGNMKIRRIFTMKNSVLELSSNDSQQKVTEEVVMKYISNLPKNLAFPTKVEYENINLSLDKINDKISNSDRNNLIPGSVVFPTTNNNTNVNRVSLIDVNVGKNLRSSIKRNNYTDISTKYRNLNKMILSGQIKEEKDKKSVNIKKSNLSVKYVRIDRNNLNNERQKSSEPRTHVRRSVKLIEKDLNNFKPENKDKRGHSSSKAMKTNMYQSNDLKELNFDSIEKLKEKIELIPNQEEDSIMKFDLDKEFEMRICDFELKNDFVQMEDIHDKMNKTQINEEYVITDHLESNSLKNEINFKENTKIEPIHFENIITYKTQKEEVKFNNYGLNSSKRNSDKKENVEIIEEIYDFDNNAEDVNVEENDLKLNLDDSFFKEDITKFSLRDVKKSEENHKNLSSQCNYFEISIHPNKETNHNNMYSSRENIKELMNKKEICDANVKKEIMKEIFKDSVIDFRDQCFSPTFKNPSTLNSDREKERKKEDFVSEENPDLIYDSIMGYYYDPKTNNYYEFKHSDGKLHI